MSNFKAIIVSYTGVLAFACLIYIAGGRVLYWQATLYVIVAIIGTTLNHLLIPKGSGQVPLIATVAGVFLMMVGQILFALAKRANPFFYSTVRIETKRKHIVCEAGPYSFIRHPGYLGMIISIVGFPLVMNSYWSYIPVVISISILVLRTYWEDGFLKANIEGYTNYVLKTRWLLIPGLF